MPPLLESGRRRYNWEDLERLSAAAAPLESLIDVDDPSFVCPADMPEAIREFCRRTGPNAARQGRQRGPLHTGKHGPEISPRARLAGRAERRPDQNDPHHRRRRTKSAAFAK